VGPVVKYLAVWIDPLRVRTPSTVEGAAFEDYQSPTAGAVVDAKSLDVEDETLLLGQFILIPELL
jgi:hypothetical protein